MNQTPRQPRRAKPAIEEASTTRGAGKTVSEAIGRQLRAIYDEVLSEPVPKDLSDLVRRLEKAPSAPRKRK
jgi:hypothetical protein